MFLTTLWKNMLDKFNVEHHVSVSNIDDRERMTHDLVSEMYRVLGRTSLSDLEALRFALVDVVHLIVATYESMGLDDKVFADTWNDRMLQRTCIERMSSNVWDRRRPVFVWDIDDVISNFRDDYAQWLIREKGLDVDPQCPEYFFTKELTHSHTSPRAYYDEFVTRRHLRDLKTLPAFDVMNRLHDAGAWIHIVTARPGTDVSTCDTYRWLDMHGAKYHKLTFTHDKIGFVLRSEYHATGKLKLCIDDSPTHVDAYVRHGINCAMPVTNYNNHISNAEFLRRYHTIDELNAHIFEVT